MLVIQWDSQEKVHCQFSVVLVVNPTSESLGIFLINRADIQEPKQIVMDQAHMNHD